MLSSPECVTVSIIIDNDNDVPHHRSTISVSSLNCPEEDEAEEERIGAWIYKRSCKAKNFLAEKVLSSSIPTSGLH